MSLDTHLIVEVVMEKKKWMGSWPANCDLCSKDLPTTEFFVDGRFRERSDSWPYIQSSRWALMCPNCFNDVGVGLGTGRGQKYDSKTLEKLEG